MFHSTFRSARSAVVSGIVIGGIALVSVGAVWAEPLASKMCNNSTFCEKFTNNGTGVGVEGVAKSGSGVEGSSSTGYGVYGTSTSGDGLHGVANAANVSGVYGQNNSSTNPSYGVFGASTNGDGVHGTTTSTSSKSAVAGLATGTSGSANGVYGSSTNGIGVYGQTSASSGAAGVEGVGNNSNNGVEAIGDDVPTSGVNYPALYAVGTNANTWPAVFGNMKTGKGCQIDPNGDLTCGGSIIGGTAVTVRQRNSGGQQVLAYTSESATPTIEDLGAARLREGIANVELPRDFSSVMSHSDAYYVFLTPMGDTRGLYVSTQTAAGFQVRENERGRSNVAFEYRIVAVPSGEQNIRLPEAPRMQTFAPPHIVRR